MQDTDSGREDVCRRLMSQKRQEYKSVLSEYFLPDCVIDNDDIYLHGRDRIKLALDFTTSICNESGLSGTPIWDERDKTITFTYFRQLKLGFRVTQITTLHLELDSTGAGGYWVNKIGDKHVNMPWTVWPILGHIHLYILRPLFSWMIIGIARLFFSDPKTRKKERRPS